MFGIDSTELLLIAVVALVVIGPKDLPRVLRVVGGWVGKGRAMSRHVRSGFDTMMREAELEEMQKMWAKQNADIMAMTEPTPVPDHVVEPAPLELPAPAYDGEMTGPLPVQLTKPELYEPAPEPHSDKAA